MASTIYTRGETKGRVTGRVEVLAEQLLRRLGKSKKVAGLVKRLPLCSDRDLHKVSLLIVDEKEDKALLAAVERLIPRSKD